MMKLTYIPNDKARSADMISFLQHVSHRALDSLFSIFFEYLNAFNLFWVLFLIYVFSGTPATRTCCSRPACVATHSTKQAGSRNSCALLMCSIMWSVTLHVQLHTSQGRLVEGTHVVYSCALLYALLHCM